ncbi:MAG: hypothetical protein JWL75_254 [Parcubacteria group bacterium]|nr:hypothetical protein [Parcubacteria group bacterium]
MSRLLPFIAILFAIVLFLLYIKPTYSGSIHDTKQQIGSYDQALAAADRFQAKEAQLTQARSQIPADSLARLNSFLPDGVDNVQLILDMDALAARSGITLSDFNTDGSNTKTTGPTNASTPPVANIPQTSPNLALNSSSPIDSLNLTFKATGTYSSFRAFLSGMENSLRPLDVVNLDVTQAKNGVYTYGVTVRIYWLH